jgi:hypothetical protein
VQSNKLTGTVPAWLSRMTALTTLALFTNPMSGVIPPQLGSMTNLQRLTLYNNGLSGTIPAELGGMSSLTLLCVAVLVHCRRVCVCTCMRKSALTSAACCVASGPRRSALHMNSLSGSIPAALGSLSTLQMLCAAPTHAHTLDWSHNTRSHAHTCAPSPRSRGATPAFWMRTSSLAPSPTRWAACRR